MFFALSKVVFFFLTPSNICLFALAAGIVLMLWRPAARIGRRLALGGLAATLVLGFAPVGAWMTLPLENRFPPARPGVTPAYAGIIMLGGFEDGRTSVARGQLTLNEAGERFVETLRLARRYPTAKIIFTGGPASLILNQKSAGRAIADAMRDLGLDASRVVLETASFNTWQNATMTRAIVKPRPGQRFLLVTSAWHMPRSMGVFRKAGFEVDAWPVDYRTADTSDLIRPFGRVTEGLERVDFATKEWIGLVAYYLTGRSSALFPAP